jgi:hypothetical protein
MTEYANQLVLKGGSLIQTWLGDDRHSTRDIDFSGIFRGGASHVNEMCRFACGVPCEDGMVYDDQGTNPHILRENLYYGLYICISVLKVFHLKMATHTV